jgi:ComF family protein
MVNNILEGLFPTYCVLCGQRSARELPLCFACQASLAPNRNGCKLCALPLSTPATPGATRLCANCQARPPPYSRVIAPWLYDEQMAFLMHRWKFHGERRFTPLLAELWLQTRVVPTAVDVLVPVPLHWWRLCRRGFNQAELLCHQLRTLGVSLPDGGLNPGLVSRTRATAAQANLTASNRDRNLQGAFKVHQDCNNLRIAVVDDVMTTGSTVTAITHALKTAGAKSVEVWCIARTPAPPN